MTAKSRKVLLIILLSVFGLFAAAFSISACVEIVHDVYYSVEKNIDDAGTVKGVGGYDNGDRVTFTAETNLGYTFLGWFLGDELVCADNVYTFTVRGFPDSDGVVSGGGEKPAVVYKARWRVNSEMFCYSFVSTPEKCKVTGLKDKTVKNLVFPSYVTEIGDKAFENEEGITCASVPDNVLIIGQKAFSGCKSLSELTIANGVTQIESFAFESCKSLSAVEIPQTVEVLQNGAFYACENLSSVKLNYGLEELDAQVFAYCKSLKKIVLPASVKKLGEYAFSGCGSLREIKLSGGLTEIGVYAFESTALTEIYLPQGVKSVGKGAFKSCGNLSSISVNGNNRYFKSDIKEKFLLTADGKTLLEASDDGIIPDGVEVVAEEAATGRCGIENMVFPDSVRRIERVAFGDCKNLTAVRLNRGLEFIGVAAFSGCEKLVTINIPDSVEKLDDYVFERCLNLSFNEYGGGFYLGDEGNGYAVLVKAAQSVTNLQVHEGARFIASNACFGNADLTCVTLPEGLKAIGGSAFYNCEKLTFINIPDSVTQIDEWAFAFCPALQGYEYGNAIYIGNESDNYKLLVRVKDKEITSCAVKGGVKFFTAYAFESCEKLETVELEDGLETLPEGIFAHCTALKRITVPQTVKKIESDAFFMCSALEWVTFYEGLEEIGEDAFNGCQSLKTVVVPASLKVCPQSAFSYQSLRRLYFKGNIKDGWDMFGHLPQAFYYSQTEPNSADNFWHYENGEIAEWKIGR